MNTTTPQLIEEIEFAFDSLHGTRIQLHEYSSELAAARWVQEDKRNSIIANTPDPKTLGSNEDQRKAKMAEMLQPETALVRQAEALADATQCNYDRAGFRVQRLKLLLAAMNLTQVQP